MEPFLLLGDIVKDYRFVNQNHFRMLSCERKGAFGCGHYGGAILQGLSLFVRLGREDDPSNSPKLAIAVSDEAFNFAGLQLAAGKEQSRGTLNRISARIYTVDGAVMVIRISFVPDFDCDELSYYLVYDSDDKGSFFLLPRRPTSCQHIYTKVPLKVKAGGQGKYSLVLMAERSVGGSAKHPVLCTWSPPPHPFQFNQRSPWDMSRLKPVNAGISEAHVVFSFKGSAVWGDLAQGIIYCDCSDLIHTQRMGSRGPVQFKHIMLPEECRTTHYQFDDPMPVYRNMGCVGDSIWFVIIEPSVTSRGDTKVKVWTLDSLSANKWNLHTVFSMRTVWKLEPFKALRLPKNVPQYPILRQEDDGAIYMFLREPYTGGEAYTHLLRIDLSSSCEVYTLSARRMIVQLMERPVVVPPSFFRPLPMAV